MQEELNYKIFTESGNISLSEKDIFDYDPNILNLLLIDRTMTNKNGKDTNIFWATNDYENLGDNFKYNSEIIANNIVNEEKQVIAPRILKNKTIQASRTKDKAEVFTPSWICNAQNNLIDNAWFEQEEVFNKELIDNKGKHIWITNNNKILFPNNKDWKSYVMENVMEITCGEAPYITSRYDTTTGSPIPIINRIGLLDRKLRVINENASSKEEWLDMTIQAFKHTYAYEWQGDNIFLARKSLLLTFVEYYINYFNAENKILTNVPNKNTMEYITSVISWNIWQMDGLKMVIPNSCNVITCKACKKKKFTDHTGIHCIIKNWDTNNIITFSSLLKE